MTKLNSFQKWTLMVAVATVLSVTAIVFLSEQTASSFSSRSLREDNETRWNSLFQNNVALGGFPSTTRYHIRQGMYQWDDVHTGADFDVHEDYSNEDSYVQPVGFRGAGYANIPAITTHIFSNGRITFSAISLNKDWSWDVTSCAVDWPNEEADVRVVITHESGHLISLGHDPNHKEAVMWPDDTCKLTTVTDDHNGVIAAYGSN